LANRTQNVWQSHPPIVEWQTVQNTLLDEQRARRVTVLLSFMVGHKLYGSASDQAQDKKYHAAAYFLQNRNLKKRLKEWVEDKLKKGEGDS
jgi:hypothetical protein